MAVDADQIEREIDEFVEQLSRRLMEEHDCSLDKKIAAGLMVNRLICSACEASCGVADLEVEDIEPLRVHVASALVQGLKIRWDLKNRRN